MDIISNTYCYIVTKYRVGKNFWSGALLNTYKEIFKSSPVTGLEWPREFQEVMVPRFHDSGTGWW